MLISFILSLALLSGNALAGMPRFPDLSKWDNMTEQEKAEAGAFLLFYELASKKVIGGRNGLCVDWQPSDNVGSPGKISVGMPSDEFFVTGKSTLKPQMVTEAEKLKQLLTRVKDYLDSGCAGDANCLQNRTLNLSGYADGQRFGANPAMSLQNNTKLAYDRANTIAGILSPVGFVQNPELKGFNSPRGEAVRERKEQIPNYRVDCKERRATVVDIGFEAKGVDTQVGDGTMAPSVFSASRRFVHLSSLAASMQIVKAAGNLIAVANDQQADQLIDKIMQENGVTDPSIVSACKNAQTRTMVKEHIRNFNAQPANIRSSLTNQFNKGERATLLIAGANQQTPENRPLLDYYKNMQKGFGGLQDMSRYPDIATSGKSTSLNDCFSAKNSLSADMSLDSNLRKRMCKPTRPFMKSGSNELNVKFEPPQLNQHTPMHIGCNKCMTGFRFTPTTVIDTNTGRERKVLTPSYRDREMNEAPTRPLLAPSYFAQNFSGLGKTKGSIDKVIKSLRQDVQAYQVKGTPIQIRRLNIMKMFLSRTALLTIDGKAKLSAPVSKTLEELKTDPDFQSMLSELQMSNEGLSSLIDLNQRVLGKGAITTEAQYVKSKMNGVPGPAIDKYESIYYPGVHAREVLGGWWQNEANQAPKDNLSFGGMKNPRFYLLDNCDCEAEDLLEQAVQNGRPYPIDEVPLRVSAQSSPNSCLISIPTPPSCLVDPNEKGVDGKDGKAPESRIKWLGSDGDLMDKAITEMPAYFQGLNAQAQPRGCEDLSPAQIAQKIVDSVQCRGERNLPHGANEELDCATP